MVDILKGERDKWVRPVDVAVAPDGSIFVSDWYDPVIGWNRQEDTEHGRIFRIAPAGHRYRPPEHDFDSVEGAVEALKSPSYAVRYLAWQSLDHAGEAAEGPLAVLFADGPEVRHRARALWLLARIEGRGPAYVRQGLDDSEEDIRTIALRAAQRGGMDLVPLIEGLLSDPSAHVRRECATALRTVKSPRAAVFWAQLASRHVAGDRWSLEALGIGADDNWDSCLDTWLEVIGKNWNSPTGRDILWRSRAAATPEFLARILSGPEGLEAGAARYLRAFDFQPASDSKTRNLRQLAFGMSKDGEPHPFFIASEALLRLPTFDLASNPRTRASIGDLLDRGAGTEQFARLVQRYELTDRYPDLLEVAAGNKDNPVGIAATRTLLDAGAEHSILAFIRAQPGLAVATVEAVANTRSSSAVPLLETVVLDSDLPPPVRDRAVRSMAGFTQGAQALVDMRRRGDFPAELAEIAGAAITRSMNVRLRAAAAELFPVPPLRGGEPVPQMTDLLVLVGNPKQGAGVFESATCSDCHVVNGQGKNFGPELSKIGDKLSKAGLYESVLDPSDGVSPDFQLVHFTLADSQEVSGFVVDESGDSVTLRMEGGILSEFPKDQIVERRESAVSAMPDDLQEQMSVDDLVDLVEYLSRLR